MNQIASLPYAQFSGSAETFFRTCYSALLLLQLLWTAPHASRFFASERWGGYIEASPWRDRVHTRTGAYGVLGIWVLAAIALLTGRFVLPAAIVHFALSYYFFVNIRWSTILRGMGAPGHMNYWLAACILLLSLGDALPDTPLRAATVMTFRIDFAVIMLLAGIYKLSAGYFSGDGFERGLANPWWGWWSSVARLLSPSHIAFRLLNHAAYIAEIICALTFLYPPAAPYGALVLGLSFLGIGTVIRLTFLAEMVATCCLLYIWPNTPADAFISSFAHSTMATTFQTPLTSLLGQTLAIALLAYVALLAPAYAVMVTNFYFRRRVWSPFQRFFDQWNAFFGLILWRVFTNDIINFFCTISRIDDHSNELPIRQPFRFSHVGEFICLASIFTTLKYYPNDRALFEKRLARYCRSLPGSGICLFRYHRIEREQGAFSYVPIAEFLVDTTIPKVWEHSLDDRYDAKQTEPGSPIHTFGRPGSYAPNAGNA